MATKTSKKEKTIKKTEETDTEHSSDEMETHSIWNGRFKRSPENAKFFRDFLTDLNNEFIDQEGFEAILKHYWGDSIENLNKLITKQNKREKKVKETFKPEGLSKPKSAYNLYCKYYAKECKEKEVKFELKNASSSWNELSDEKKEPYNKEASKQKEEYKTNYETLKTDAVKNGDIASEKPKGPTTAYFHFVSDKRSEIKEKLIKEGETTKLNTKVTVEAGKMWKKLSAEEKEPYETIYREEKEKYKEVFEKWNSIELSRLKKLAGEAEEVQINEITGTDKDEGVEEVKADTDHQTETETETETEPEEVKEKVKSSKSKKEPKELKETKEPKTPKTKKEKKVTLTEEEDA